MRKYARHIAKVNMKKSGLSKICKDSGRRSFFSKNWHIYVNVTRKK